MLRLTSSTTIRRIIVAIPVILSICVFAGAAQAKHKCWFCKGGRLSINKPFSKGGGASIDKPFNRGGGLSINKVDVPKPLQIGRVDNIEQIIIPVCWGSPQECRGMKPDEAKAKIINSVSTQAPYYITAQFICRIKNKGSTSGRTCSVTQASTKSCEDAIQQMNAYPSVVGDPCTQCAGVTVSDEYWDMTPPEHTQGGLCSGR